ncbi:helix-turn-helix domain-containing protein [Streptomyces sp. NPDC056004]|uniref:helix-turn-helix domain-containing protein n=1 Tax=Streptomyces sp. NPDC056004 TaxID=3345677 RepID=UPI0035E27B4B
MAEHEKVSKDDALAQLRDKLAGGLARENLTKTQLARAVSLSRSTISAALQQDGPVPSRSTVSAMARRLGLSEDDIDELWKRAAGKAVVGRETPQNPPAARPRDDVAVREQFTPDSNDQGGGDDKAEGGDAPEKPGSVGTRLRSRPILVATAFLCGALTGALAFFIPTHRSVAGDADIYSSGSCKVSKLACLYTDDFKGGVIGLKPGQEVKSFEKYGLNDQISSWRNYAGVTCYWYTDEDFKGEPHSMVGSTGVNLGKWGHENDTPSSVRCDSK